MSIARKGAKLWDGSSGSRKIDQVPAAVRRLAADGLNVSIERAGHRVLQRRGRDGHDGGPRASEKDNGPGKGGPGKGGGKGGNGQGDEDGRTGLVTKTRPKTKKPSLYRVLLLNDDYTPMEFVVHVLEKYFSKGREEATRIMLHVHHKGSGICGVFTYEVAETKVTQVMDFSRQHGHPLQCTMEKE